MEKYTDANLPDLCKSLKVKTLKLSKLSIVEQNRLAMLPKIILGRLDRENAQHCQLTTWLTKKNTKTRCNCTVLCWVKFGLILRVPRIVIQK
jgi:hypothetical protein